MFSGRAAADWDPDVALINYYRQGDTLGGHKDDVEQDQTAPIVALSLGCSAIFLLGGIHPASSRHHLHFCQLKPVPLCSWVYYKLGMDAHIPCYLSGLKYTR